MTERFTTNSGSRLRDVFPTKRSHLRCFRLKKEEEKNSTSNFVQGIVLRLSAESRFAASVVDSIDLNFVDRSKVPVPEEAV